MKGNTMKRILFAAMLTFSAPVFAQAQVASSPAFFLINNSYAQLRTVAENCNLSPETWVSFKATILAVLSEDPKTDVIQVGRDMDSYYREEKSRIGRDCTDDHRKLYQTAAENIEFRIERLRSLVREGR